MVPRLATAAALVAVLVALALPASVASAGSGPTATKSGVLVNYLTTGKLKVGKRIQILLLCSQNCNVTSNSRIKGPGVNLPATVSGALQAGVPGGPFFKPNGPLLRALRARPGAYRLVNKIIAIDAATGTITDAIARTFKFKR